MKLVALGGSLRGNSLSAAALRSSLSIATGLETVVDMIDLRVLDLPLHNPDVPIAEMPHAPRHAIDLLLRSCRDADVMIWASPTYHGAMSGALKNAIDHMQHLAADALPYLQGKAVGLVSISDSSPLAGMADCVHELRAWLAPTRLTLTSADFSPNLSLTGEPALRRMTRLVKELLDFASQP